MKPIEKNSAVIAMKTNIFQTKIVVVVMEG
jgi:hypothetical protein